MPPYEPDQWQDFFVTVGGGAAALTGLAVVAISMHVQTITRDPVQRHRARMILSNLAGVFMRCSLALMGGQNGRAVAIELCAVCIGVLIIGLFSYMPISEIHKEHWSSLLRTIGSMACYSVEILGALLLFFEVAWGLRLAAIAMITNFFFSISGSWLLLLGAQRDETPER